MEKVLLIEDNRMVKILHERMLTKAGYQVISAADGEEALRLARRVNPDVILLDMLLPKVSGHDVLRSLKQDRVTAHIPVIVVTGLSQKNEDRLLRDGAAGFIEKGHLLDDAKPLLHMIRVILNESRLKKSRARLPEIELSWSMEEIDPAHAASAQSLGDQGALSK
jgi:twitching motility two-component system response regulator PilH